MNRRVTQRTIPRTICVPGYSRSLRPPSSYTAPLKLKLMARYGASGSPRNFELDHLIPLELGGDPRSPRNLWPESFLATAGARAKDVVENKLHRAVCDGKMLLATARTIVRSDWRRGR